MEHSIQSLLGGPLLGIEADTLLGVTPRVKIEQQGETLWKVSFTYTLPQDGTQDDCAVRLLVRKNPPFVWSPHLTPEEGLVADRHIFRTPALIVRYEDATLWLLPDVRGLDGQQNHCYLDVDAPSGKLSLGFSCTEVEGHVLYRKVAGATYTEGEHTLSFFLLRSEEAVSNPFRPVLALYWERYGGADFAALTRPHTDLMPYVHHTYRWAFENWRDVVWQGFEIDGVAVGAPVFIVTTTQSPNFEGPKKERELRSVWNQAWFCSLRSASGLLRYARRMGREDLAAYAMKTKELALCFPQAGGLFPSVVATRMESAEDGSVRSLGWDTRYFGNSDRNPFVRSVEQAPLHILDMSFTADNMLRWYEELEQDERLLAYAGRYAERLLELQDAQGFFPGWVDGQGRPMGVLDQGPESSMSAVFLLRYHRITGEARALAAAQKCARAVLQEIVPTGRWEDFETYWSCCHFWNDHVGQKVPRNNMHKQCNFSMYYTALLLLDLFETMGEKAYLTSGQLVLDEMLMTQSSYQPKAMPLPVVGGFGVLNADAELNDARQSLFCELILRYGQALGSKEYQERGLAALRISFSMMYCPENPDAKAQWEAAWPFLGEADYGFNMENYGHNGVTDSHGLGIGEFAIYDWGNGAASESYLRMLDHLGEDVVCKL